MDFLRLLSPMGIDFRVYYEAAVLFLSGGNPYHHLVTLPGPFNYPPPVFLFIFWLGLLPITIAGPVWNILSTGALIGAIYLTLRLGGLIGRSAVWLTVVLTPVFTIFFFPAKFNLGNGQINTFLLLLVLLGLVSYIKKNRHLSAILLAAAISIKLVPAVFLLIFVVNRDWRQLVRITLWTGLFFAVPFVVMNPHFLGDYYFKVSQAAWQLAGKEVYYDQSLEAFLARSLKVPLMITGINYGLAVVLLVVTWLQGKKIGLARLIAAIACLYLLLNPLAWQHHFVFVVVPLIILGVSFWQEKKSWAWWLILSVAYLLLAIDIKNFATLPSSWRFILSHDFYGGVILWFLAIFPKQAGRYLAVLWISLITLAYILMLLCRAKVCF